MAIAKAVDKGLPAIRDKYEKICDNEFEIFPDEYLFDCERKEKQKSQKAGNANGERIS